MANLWGFENIQTAQPRKKEWWEDIAPTMVGMTENAAKGLVGYAQEKNKRELALRKMGQQDAQFNRQMLLSEEKQNATAREKALNQRLQPMTDFEGQYKKVSTEPEAAPAFARIQALKANPEIRESGSMSVPGPTLPGGAAIGGGDMAPPRISAADEMQTVQSWMPPALSAIESRKQQEELQKKATSGAALSFDQRIKLQNNSAANQARLRSVTAGKVGPDQVIVESVMPEAKAAGEASRKGVREGYAGAEKDLRYVPGGAVKINKGQLPSNAPPRPAPPPAVNEPPVPSVVNQQTANEYAAALASVGRTPDEIRAKLAALKGRR